MNEKHGYVSFRQKQLNLNEIEFFHTDKIIADVRF